MNYSRLVFIVLKEYIRKPLIWLILLAIPMTALFINITDSQEHKEGIKVGYYFSDSTENEEIKKAFQEYDGLYLLIEYPDENSLKEGLLKDNIECAYAFPSDFQYKMLNRDNEGAIKVYITDSTTMTAMINETIYSLVYPNLSREKLANYLTDKSAVSQFYEEGIFDKEDINEIYQKYLTNGSTFHFNYNNKASEFKLSYNSILLNPLKGLIGIFIMLSALSGAYSVYGEGNVLIKKSPLVRLCYIAVPCLLAFISSIITSFIAGNKISDHSTITVVAILAIYSLAIICVTFLLTFIIRKAVIFASLIPVVVIASIIFTPMIIDISAFISIVRYISYILPPYYLIIFL